MSPVILQEPSVQLSVVAPDRADKTRARALVAPTTTRRTVLYIGSDPDCRVTLARMVRRLDRVQLVVAQTGREGRVITGLLTPSLILLDTQLSDCDAHDLMVFLGRAARRAVIPLAVLSGDETDRIAFIRAGAVAWITKPLRIAEVEHSMMTLLDLFSSR